MNVVAGNLKIKSRNSIETISKRFLMSKSFIIPSFIDEHSNEKQHQGCGAQWIQNHSC